MKWGGVVQVELRVEIIRAQKKGKDKKQGSE